MKDSLEMYFLMNFLVDTSLMAIVARTNNCLHIRRLLPAGMLAAFYALAVHQVSPELAHPLIQAPLLAIVSLMLCADPYVRRWSALSVRLISCALLAGGAGMMVHDEPTKKTFAVCSGLLLALFLLKEKNCPELNWEITVCILHRGKAVTFPALIDTGNRLREPVSGQPVLIAETAVLQPLLREDCEAFRNVSFGALGGTGTIRCFRPESVLIYCGDRLIHAPEVWIADYRGTIPGSARALAPPSFAAVD